MKAPIILASALLVACSATTPVVENTRSEDEASSGMLVVSDTRFDNFYVKDKAALASYKGLYFEPLNFENLTIDQSRLHFRDRRWEFTERDVRVLQRGFTQKVSKVFDAEGEFGLETEPSEGVLKVSFELVRFAPNASKDDGISRTVRQKVWTRSVGDLSVIATLSDSVSGESIVVLEDLDEVGDTIHFERNDRPNNTRKMKMTMERWLQHLKTTLEALKTA